MDLPPNRDGRKGFGPATSLHESPPSLFCHPEPDDLACGEVMKDNDSFQQALIPLSLFFLSLGAYPDFLLDCAHRRPRMWFSSKRTTRSRPKPQLSTGNPGKPNFLLHCSHRRPRMWFSSKRTTRSRPKPQLSTGNPGKPTGPGVPWRDL